MHFKILNVKDFATKTKNDIFSNWFSLINQISGKTVMVFSTGFKLVLYALILINIIPWTPDENPFRASYFSLAHLIFYFLNGRTMYDI